jgi:RNA polymerase sigma-70 factor, ECF subfamily
VREGPALTSEHVRTELDDALDLARAGDEAGFTQLYRALQPRVVRYAATLVGAEAEDVAAEVWFQVARDLHRFSGDAAGFRGWVSTITRNRSFDHHRARTRRPVVLDDVLALSDRPASDDPARDALDRLGTARAVALIASLPRDQGEAVMLRAVMGLDAATAGEVLGKRAGAVRVAAHRGLRRLAAELAAAGDDGETPWNDA